MKIPVLYEDKDVLVINKPAGLVVHADGRTEEPTLVDWILENYPKIKEVGEPLKLNHESRITNHGDGEKISDPDSSHNSKLVIHNSIINRPGIVHRLDRDTSGALVIAKNQKAFLNLKQQFQDREVEKHYRTFVYGELKQDEAVIDRPIGRSSKDFRLWSAQRGAKGTEREAVTEYKVLGRDKGFSFVDVKPKTGRTHQIRVHFKAINYPIVCDKLYAPKMKPALGFKRLALHSFSVDFTLPSGKLVKVEAPYPKDFREAMKVFKLDK